MPAQYALHLSCEALLTDPEDKAQCTAKWGWWWNGVQIEVRKDQQWYFSQPFPYPLFRSITILISRRRARVSERMRTRKRWARVGREKGEAGSRCGPFTREWGKRKIEINRLHETHTHTRVFVRMHHMRNCEPDSTMIPAPKKWRHRDSDNRPKFPRVAVHADSVRPYGAPQNESRHIC